MRSLWMLAVLVCLAFLGVCSGGCSSSTQGETRDSTSAQEKALTEKRVEEVKNNPHIPDAAKEQVIGAIKAQQAASQSRASAQGR